MNCAVKIKLTKGFIQIKIELQTKSNIFYQNCNSRTYQLKTLEGNSLKQKT